MTHCAVLQAMQMVDPYDDCCFDCHDGARGHEPLPFQMPDGAEVMVCCGTRAILERRRNEPAFRAQWLRTVQCIDCQERAPSPGRARQLGWIERLSPFTVWLCPGCAEMRTVQAQSLPEG